MSFRIRKAKFSDARFWLDLRNQPDVLRVSFSRSKVTWKVHKIWFRKTIQSGTKDFYVLLWERRRVGQIRIDHVRPGASIISIAIVNKMRGKGLGAKAVIAASKKFFQKHPKKTLIANIKPENFRSAQCFESAGYLYKGRAVVQKQPCKRYIANK